MAKPTHLKNERAKKRVHDERIHTARSLKEALVEIDKLEIDVKAMRTLKNNHASHNILARQSSGTSEATAIALATDWHIGSRIRPEQVSGLNTFDTAIARKRADTFFERVVRLTEKERQDVKIDELILFLGGDFIDGMLHLDTIQSNEIAEPIAQSVIAQEMIESGLNFLLNHGKYKRITCVCCDGN